MRGSRFFFQGGGGGVQIPRRGLTENFNMAKIKNLAIPGGSGPPVPPISGSAHENYRRTTENYRRESALKVARGNATKTTSKHL